MKIAALASQWKEEVSVLEVSAAAVHDACLPSSNSVTSSKLPNANNFGPNRQLQKMWLV